MSTRRKLEAMRQEIVSDRTAVVRVLRRPKDAQLLKDLNRYFEAELGVVDLSLEFKDRGAEHQTGK